MDHHSEKPDTKYSEDSRLDTEFRQILCVIKYFIVYVNSNYKLSLYRSWLEKLSTTNSEKAERNKYLMELASQIKNNTILSPFDKKPPIGPLKCFPEIDKCSDSHQSPTTFKNHLIWPIPDELEELAHPVASFNPNFNHQCEVNENTRNTSFPSNQVKNNFPPSEAYNCSETLDDNYYHSYYLNKETSGNSEERNNTHQKIKSRKSKVPDQVNDTNKFNELPKQNKDYEAANKQQPIFSCVQEDSSWCDLTDTSVTSLSKVRSLGSGDAEKIKNAQHFPDLNKDKEARAINHEKNEPTVICTVQAAESSKKQDSQEFNKLPLKDTNFIPADWKKTIEALQIRLTETLGQNNELKSVIENLTAEIKFEAASKEQNEIQQRRFSEVHQQEVESLRKIQEENINKLEKSFQIKLDETEKKYQQKIEEIKINYETKIREVKLEHENAKREKDGEICRLSEIIQQQCIRMSNEIGALRKQIENSSNNNHDERIFVLQKCVSKMDKLFYKSEKEYMRQIEKLKHELELKEKVSQIQLRTQRAELIARTSAERQKQLDEVVNNLEVKYIKMLEYHENQVMENKKQDEEKIDHLKYLLDKNFISYKIT